MAVAQSAGGDFKLKINNVKQLTTRECVYSVTGPAAEVVETGDGTPIFRKSTTIGYIEVGFIDAPGVSSLTIRRTQNATIQLTLGSGKIVTGTAMQYVGDGSEVSAVNADFTARFMGTVTEAV